jgi:hypothetical protein
MANLESSGVKTFAFDEFFKPANHAEFLKEFFFDQIDFCDWVSMGNNLFNLLL